MRKNPYPGIFIEFEGIDGSGKSTAAMGLQASLEQLGFPTVLTKEPTNDSPFGILVRRIYTQKIASKNLSRMLRSTLEEAAPSLFKDTFREMLHHEQKNYFRLLETIADELKRGEKRNIPLLVQLCMIFDRMCHLGFIIPKLGEGFIVLADRYFLSTLAYGGSDGIDWHILLRAQDILLNAQFIMPDLVLFIDVPARVGIERAIEKQRRFGTEQELERVRSAYGSILNSLRRTKKLRVAAIDGTLSPSAVVEQSLAHIKKIIRAKNLSSSYTFETQ